MTKKEFSELCKTIQAAYPRDVFLEQQEQYTLWWDMMNGCSYEFAKLAVKNYILGNRYLPNLSDIMTRYNAVKSDAMQKKMNLKEIYYFIRDNYPQAFRGTNSEVAYWSLIKSKTYGECLAKAESIKKWSAGYVRRMEKSGSDRWMSLEECMAEALNERS